jgi:predicted nucleotidyltransferase
MSGQIQIEIPREQVAEFCRRHHIRKLSLFGSVLRDDFGPESDIDVLVEFEPEAMITIQDIIQMEEELTALLGRKVDLVDRSGLRNPFRRHEILNSQETIFVI